MRSQELESKRTIFLLGFEWLLERSCWEFSDKGLLTMSIISKDYYWKMVVEKLSFTCLKSSGLGHGILAHHVLQIEPICSSRRNCHPDVDLQRGWGGNARLCASRKWSCDSNKEVWTFVWSCTCPTRTFESYDLLMRDTGVGGLVPTSMAPCVIDQSIRPSLEGSWTWPLTHVQSTCQDVAWRNRLIHESSFSHVLKSIYHMPQACRFKRVFPDFCSETKPWSGGGATWQIVCLSKLAKTAWNESCIKLFTHCLLVFVHNMFEFLTGPRVETNRMFAQRGLNSVEAQQYKCDHLSLKWSCITMAVCSALPFCKTHNDVHG